MPRVEICDPFGVTNDLKMSFLKDALDPVQAGRQLQQCLSDTQGMDAALSAIRVCRYKPGRRCLIEYQLQTDTRGPLKLLGKGRAKGIDHATWAVVKSLWEAGFSLDASDRISIPEPVGIVSAFNMWLQIKVEGESLTHLLQKPHPAALAFRVAEAAHKLHSTHIPTARHHTVADELSILLDRLEIMKGLRPEWARRLNRVAIGCEQLARSLPPSPGTGIHRDFYADQVIVSGPRLWLVDFDLYCHGDPALDIGNFLAHVTETSLRMYSDPAALRPVEQALETRFVELRGNQARDAVAAYAVLSLARHIHISTLFPDRQPLTERILALCEERLGLDPTVT